MPGVEPAVQLVQELACPDCDVTVHDLRQGRIEKIRAYGIKTVPVVVVEGRLVSCCENSGPRREELEGIGQRL